MRDPTRQSMRSTRRAPREDATNVHAFPRIPRHTNASIHPAHRSPVSTLASHRIASRRVHHRRPASPPPSSRPPVAPARRHPTTDDPSADVRADASKKHIEPTFRARTTHRSPRATGRGRRHGRRRHRPHHHRPRPRRACGIEPAASDVTAARARPMGVVLVLFFGYFFWILIRFGVCPLRTCRVVYS